jgi:ferritin
MLNENVEKKLLLQIEKEFYSSNLYLAMGAWAESKGYAGIADWLYAQADEERLHALKFLRYVTNRGGNVIVPALEQPPVDYKSVKNLFEMVLDHEELITNSINQIVFVALKEEDFTTHNWVQWFVNEQIEEESNVRTILDKIKLAGDNLYLFDRDIMTLRQASANEAGA